MTIYNKFLSATLLLVLLTSCTKGDVIYRMIPMGHVIIRPDDSKHFLPNVRYHFYCTDESRTAPILDKCDGKGNYAGDLPMGTYCVLATNTGAANVNFSGMENQETAVATVQSLTRGGALLAQPGDLFSITLEELIPSATDTVRYTPEPVLLTKHVIFSIQLEEKLGNEVTSMSGLLDGVYPSVHLYHCLAANEALNPETGATAFAVRPSATSVSSWRADVALFGIRDPERGNTYTNEVALTINQGNDTDVVNVDISDYLSDAIEDNGGELPIRIPVEITISEGDIGLIGDVIPWKDVGNGNGEIIPEGLF